MTGPELCPKCKGLHYRNSPCIVRVTKSTASRKDGKSQAIGMPARRDDNTAKGTQAPSVDTAIKRPVGRPKTITDMKAYKAKWAREYRARLKEKGKHKQQLM